jgi:hypothetical protein
VVPSLNVTRTWVVSRSSIGEVVEGLLVVSDRPVDQGPDVIAVDPVLLELVDEHVAIEQGHRDGVGDVHLSADHLEWALGLPAAVRVGRLAHVDFDPSVWSTCAASGRMTT